MKFVYFAGALILVTSLVANCWLVLKNAEIREEYNAHIEDILKSTREADRDSILHFDFDKAKAEAQAKEKRDVLKNFDIDSISIRDLLNRCRDGLFKDTTDRSSDTSSSAHGSLRPSSNTNRPESR